MMSTQWNLPPGVTPFDPHFNPDSALEPCNPSEHHLEFIDLHIIKTREGDTEYHSQFYCDLCQCDVYIVGDMEVEPVE